ncbi:MAG: formylglycine-generating enzyme family protein [Gammaproteobacteria bacterium]|nr:formylglycine-generating enzyme family protein [Gammaproteobacteria bacterium]MDH5728482.1 formylglycine-generating enzyme family protein [Gammaproteobacteria bacterium]
MKQAPRRELTPEQIYVRKRYIGATFVTCVVLSLLGGTIHVLQLGSNRMQEMRNMAAFDLAEEEKHLRAAGEDLYISNRHEFGKSHSITYTLEEAESLIGLNEWKMVATMVTIPEGEFIMGTDSLKSDIQNRPRHKRSIKSFKIDKYPVTNAQYARFVAATGRRVPINWKNGKFPPEKALHPVTMVTWFDAKDYAKWAGKRLPTEEEWEKAARGDKGLRWPWGEQMDPTRLNTYYTVGSTTPVNAYKNGASSYGVMDMAGNVQEWVEDEFNPYQESTAPEHLFKAKKPVVPEDSKLLDMSVAEFVETDSRYKVMRGGSWKSDPFSTSSYHRNFSWPQMTADFFGFRCAQDIN